MCCYAAHSVLCTLHKADLAATQLNVYRIAPHNSLSAAEQGQISQATRHWLCHKSPLWRNNWVNGTVSLLHPPQCPLASNPVFPLIGRLKPRLWGSSGDHMKGGKRGTDEVLMFADVTARNRQLSRRGSSSPSG